MKVYVVYSYWAWEGCSEPLKAFDSLEKAEAYIKEESSKELGCDYSWVDLEVE